MTRDYRERPVEKPGRYSGEPGARHWRLQLIFITRHIPRNAIERTLHALHFDLPRKHAVGFDIEGFERFAERGIAFR